MEVKIISLTKPMIQGFDSMTAEELIIYIARVSNPNNQANLETSDKLLKFLLAHKHWSPLDMVDMTVEVKTSRAIAQQILRHWSHRFQEFSQRYAAATKIEPIEIRMKGTTNRQSSEEIFDPAMYDSDRQEYFPASVIIKDHIAKSKHLYDTLLEAGASAETARFVLPLATQTTLYMKGSARSWFHYLEQRLDKHAQKEHRLVAEQILGIYKQHFPNLAAALQYEKI